MAYKPYRGARARRRNRLLLVFTFILLLLIVGGVVFLTLQEHIIFTAEGFRFDFTPQTEPTTEPPASESMPPLIIEQTTTQAPTQPPTQPAPQKRQGLTAAVLVDYSAYASAPLPEGTDRKAVYIKGIDGQVHIMQGPVSNASSVPEELEKTAFMRQLAEDSSVAVLSVFRDHEGAAANRAAAVVVSGGQTWLDINRNRWFDPFKAGGVAYAQSLIGAFSTDELALTYLQFPTSGQLDLIHYSNAQDSRVDTITAAAQALAQAFRQHNPQGLLSCLLTETAASAFVDELAGQSVLELAQFFDILYVPTADPDFDTGPLYEVLADTGCRVGLWLKSDTAPSREIDFILAP